MMSRKYKITILAFITIGIMLILVNFFLKQESRCNYDFGYKKKIHPAFKHKFKNIMDKAENGYASLLIQGVIINKYNDECDHGITYIDFMTPDYFLYITPSSVTNTHNDSGMSLFSDKGDSIFKPVNSLVFTIKKKDTVAYFGFGTDINLLRDTVIKDF